MENIFFCFVSCWFDCAMYQIHVWNIKSSTLPLFVTEFWRIHEEPAFMRYDGWRIIITYDIFWMYLLISYFKDDCAHADQLVGRVKQEYWHSFLSLRLQWHDFFFVLRGLLLAQHNWARSTINTLLKLCVLSSRLYLLFISFCGHGVGCVDFGLINSP